MPNRRGTVTTGRLNYFDIEDGVIHQVPIAEGDNPPTRPVRVGENIMYTYNSDDTNYQYENHGLRVVTDAEELDVKAMVDAGQLTYWYAINTDRNTQSSGGIFGSDSDSDDFRLRLKISAK